MAKRLTDAVAAALGLILLAPLLLPVALAIRLDSPGPVFYRPMRVGRNGHLFRMVKLRTMQADAERAGLGLTSAGDGRVTRVGRFLRKWKIDELPQLINVLRGEMSLVGPRPEAPAFVALYSPEQRHVLAVRPGITGPSQVRFRHEESLLQGCSNVEAVYVTTLMPQKLALDLAYVRRRSLLGDLLLILQTVRCVFVSQRPLAE